MVFFLVILLNFSNNKLYIEPYNNVNEEIKDLHMNPQDSFCFSHLGKSDELEKSCNKLSKDGCINTKCCASIDNKCVASNDGIKPIFS